MPKQQASCVDWKKLLHRRQDCPDNYSGGEQQFLRELRKNVSVVTYSYSDAVFGSLKLVFHLNLIALYYILFENVYAGTLPVDLISSVLVLTAVLLYGIYWMFLSIESPDILDHFYTVFTLLVFGYASTPVIRTLTDTISTDTIYASSFLFALVSCIFHDYGIKAPIVSFPLSVSTGLCSSIFLLSRLQSNPPTFFLLASSFALHAFSPAFRNRLFLSHHIAAAGIVFVLSLSSIVFISQIYLEAAMIWLIIQVFLIFLVPYILISKQEGKRNLHGPWDEAVPVRRMSKY